MRSSKTVSSMESRTSKRTALPKRRRRNSASIASRRSSASSSSTSRSASRETRKVVALCTSIPSNNAGRCAMMTSSIGMKCWEFSSFKNRGKSGGTFRRAKRSSLFTGSRSMTAILSARPDTYGKGCAGSTTSGVRIGKIRCSNSRDSIAFSSADTSSQRCKIMSLFLSSGRMCSRNSDSCSATNS